MAIFNKIVVQTLSFAQRILTSTIGSELGINQLIATINSNYDNLDILLDKSKPGGGLSDSNITANSITNASTNMTEDFGEQVGSLQVSVLANGQNNFGNSVTPINRTITSPSPNKKVSISGVTEFQVTDGAAGGIVNALITIQMSYSPLFTGIIKQKTLSPLISAIGNGVWAFQATPFLVSAICPTAGTIYYRVTVSASGNETVVFSVLNTTTHATMN
jgi:hypothetical protein